MNHVERGLLVRWEARKDERKEELGSESNE